MFCADLRSDAAAQHGDIDSTNHGPVNVSAALIARDFDFHPDLYGLSKAQETSRDNKSVQSGARNEWQGRRDRQAVDTVRTQSNTTRSPDHQTVIGVISRRRR